MTEISHNLLFFITLVTTLLISVSCLKIAYIWKKRKLLFINFFLLGANYFLIFAFLSLWNYTHNLFALIVGNMLLFIWVILFSIGTFILLFPKKSPLDYAPLIYILIPFIYLFTRSVETTFIKALDLSSLIIVFSFIKLMFFGKKLVKVASTFGIIAGLITIIYIFTVFAELDARVYTLLFNAFLAVSFIGFLYISKNKPEQFLNTYNPKLDGN